MTPPADDASPRAALRVLAPYRWGVGLAFAVSALAAIPGLLVAVVVGRAIDALRAGDRGGLDHWVLMLALLGGVTALAWAVRMVLVSRATFHVETDLRARFFDRLIRLDLAQVEREDPGQLVARGTADLRLVRAFLNSGVSGVAQVIVGFTFVVAMTWSHHPYLAVIAVAPAVLVLVVSRLQIRSGVDRMRESRDRLGDATRELDETLGGMAVVRAFGQREGRARRIEEAVGASTRATTAVLRRNALFEALVTTLPLLGAAAVLVVGAWFAVRQNALTDGQLVTDFMLLLQLAGPTAGLGAIVGMAQSAAAALRRIDDVVGRPEPPAVDDAAPTAGTGGVALHGVTAGYVDGRDVLHDVDLSLPAGAHVAVTGLTGSGKSLVLGLVARLRSPRRGTVVAPARRSVALVTDADMLFSGTVRDAIAYGRRDASDEEVHAAATRAGAAAFIEALPHGYASVLGGRKGVTLSGGQRQRLLIARGLLVEPEVLLLDGATASLDAITERAVLAAIRADGARTVVSTGLRPEQVAAADLVVELEAGRVTAVHAQTPAEPDAPAPPAAAPAPAAVASAAPAPTKVDPRTPEQIRAARRVKARRRWRVLWELARADVRLLVAGGIAVVVATVASLALPYLGTRIVDDVLGPRRVDPIAELGALMLGVVAVGAVATWAKAFLVPWAAQRLLQRMRLRAVDRLLHVHMGYFDLQNPGQIISRLTNNVEMLSGMLGSTLVSICSAVALLVGSFVAFGLIDPLLALVAATAIPPLLVGAWALGRLRRWSTGLIVAGIGDLTVFLRETILGARTMRAYGQEDWHRARFAELNECERLALRRAAYVFGSFLVAAELVVGLVIALLVSVGGDQVLAGTLAVGAMVALSTYLRNAVSPLSTLVTNGASYGQATAGLEQIVGILDLPGDKDGTAAAPPRATGPAALRFENVSFAYTRDRIALHDVDLELAPGETVMIVGESGAGKTTVLRLAQRFYRPFRGRVTLDGNDVADLPDAWLRGQIALVPQEPFLFTGTVADNVRFGRPEASDEEVAGAVAAIGATAALDRLPDGLATRVGAGGAAVSSGQRQLIALARAVLVDARLLLLDEATSALDPESSAIVDDALHRARADRTTLIVAHRLANAPNVDRVVLLRHGRVVEQGTHAELLAAGGRYARLWRAAGTADGPASAAA